MKGFKQRCLLIIFLLFIINIHFLFLKNKKEAIFSSKDVSSLSYEINGWEGVDTPFSGPVADSEIMREYTDKQGKVILLYIGYHRDLLKNLPGHTPFNCYPAQGWNIISSGVKDILIPGHQALRVNKILVERNGIRSLVVFWYQRRDVVMLGRFLEQLSMIFDAVFTNRSDAGFIRFSSPVLNTEDETLKILEQFIRQSFSEILSLFKEQNVE